MFKIIVGSRHIIWYVAHQTFPQIRPKHLYYNVKNCYTSEIVCLIKLWNYYQWKNQFNFLTKIMTYIGICIRGYKQQHNDINGVWFVGKFDVDKGAPRSCKTFHNRCVEIVWINPLSSVVVTSFLRQQSSSTCLVISL
jgi:hypothetical protein